MSKLDLGPAGVTLTVSNAYLDHAAELERLGYSALWLPGGQIDDLNRLTEIIGATKAVPVGSAIISLDVYPPGSVAGLYARLEADAPGRLVAGLGGPQKPHPLPALNDFLDHLDRANPPVPAGRRLLAALGPRKLELARDRCAGAILLLVTPAYTSAAREIIGDDSTLVIEQMLVLDTDATRARQTARLPLRFLSGLPGYRASFARMGFTDDEITGLSDAFVDQMVIWGGAGTIGARIAQYRQAGADHVVLHVLSEGDQPGPMEAARQLADGLVS